MIVLHDCSVIKIFMSILIIVDRIKYEMHITYFLNFLICIFKLNCFLFKFLNCWKKGNASCSKLTVVRWYTFTLSVPACSKFLINFKWNSTSMLTWSRLVDRLHKSFFYLIYNKKWDKYITIKFLISSAQRTVACELVLLGMRLAAADIRYKWQ